MKKKLSDNRLSLFKASDVLNTTIWAENQHVRDTIEAAALDRKTICEFPEMSKEIEAELKDSGFTIQRLELMGGPRITVKWA